MATNLYHGLPNGVSPDLMAPCMFATPVTTSDSVDLTYASRGLIIATAGDLKVTTLGGNTVVLTLPAGVIPLMVTRVWTTSTTATGITAIW